jgi:hypothetical protein
MADSIYNLQPDEVYHLVTQSDVRVSFDIFKLLKQYSMSSPEIIIIYRTDIDSTFEPIISYENKICPKNKR